MDQEKSIDSTFKEVMDDAYIFLYPIHVRKNMMPFLGTDKASGISTYNRAVYAVTKENVIK